jgi:hypothetical protein
MLAEDVTGDKRLPVFRRPAVPVALLSMLTTNQKGLIAETAVIAESIKLRIGVSKPIDDERSTSSSTYVRDCCAFNASGPSGAARSWLRALIRTGAARQG